MNRTGVFVLLAAASMTAVAAFVAWRTKSGLDRDMFEMSAATNLRVLSAALEVACNSEGGCPDSEGDLAAAVDATGLSIQQKRALLTDRWGHAVCIRRTAGPRGGRIIIYSLGRNAIDEGGLGDDISEELGPSE